MRKTKAKSKIDEAKLTIGQMVKAARKAGLDVSFSFNPKSMPIRSAKDHPHVLLLVAESERCSQLGHNWAQATIPNPIAAELCFKQGWAYSLAAAWLRCKLAGELLPEKKDE